MLLRQNHCAFLRRWSLIRKVLISLLMSMLLIGVGAQAQTAPLKVVATYSILGDVVAAVGGEDIVLTVLVPGEGDPHVYEPTPQDLIALAEADILFENGLELEPWIDALYESSGSRAVRVPVSEGVDVLEFVGHHHHDHDHDHGHDHDHAHGEFDPHTWMSPRNVMVFVANIRDALAAADPANAERYAARAEAYLAELEALDAYIVEQLARIPEANRVLVATHELFAYFARDYGFTLLDTPLASVTTAAEPAAGQIALVIEEIRELGVPAIFVENVGNAALIERIASEAGVVVAPPLFTHGLGPAGSGAETYLTMMRYNIDTIVEALSS
jgi:ABC-type Zn uptake system ZnuABC Zn-binding protein ZnuA